MHQLECEAKKLTCSTMAVANYIIRNMRLRKLHISKTKLQNMMAHAHIKHIILYNRPLVAEPLRILHYGFVFKSLFEFFSCLNHSEDIIADAYILAENVSGAKTRQYTIESDLTDPEQIIQTQEFLDDVISHFAYLTDKEAIHENILPGKPWHYFAFVKTPGNHLIEDFSKISNKAIAKAKAFFQV